VSRTSLARRSRGSSTLVDVLGERLTWLLPTSATGGAVLLARITSPPGGGPPALHTHPPLESFYVLEGEYEISGVAEEGPFTVRGTAGSAVHIPTGAPHNHENGGSGGSPDPARLLPVLAKHHVELLGPPPGTT
jgi:quercetin dioxygenase-like cupin family protein